MPDSVQAARCYHAESYSMRAAHILRKYNPVEWGGTETAVKQLVDGLKAQNVESIVYSPKLPTPPANDPFLAAGHSIKRYHAFVPVFNLTGEQRAQLVSIGGNLMSFDLLGGLLCEPKLSIIHTHTLNRIGGIALTVARLKKVPLVITIHGGVLDLPKSVRQTLSAPLEGGYEWGKIFGALFRSRHVLEKADAIITCNPREAELQREKFPNKKIIVQPHGVPMDKYRTDRTEAALSAYPTLGTRKIILIVGRIDPVKNQGWVLVQMPEILQKHPDATLVIAGSCTDELYGKALRKEVRRLGIEEKVLFTGGLPPGDQRLIGLMQLASIVVVPSLSETFGLIILEAWAAGSAVLSTRTSGALSLVEEGNNGHLFNLDSPAEFHGALNALLDSPTNAKRLAEAGRSLAASQYDATLLSARIKALYDELIEGRK
jgi:glycosyltransferase involved in cell wall biosynthesis